MSNRDFAKLKTAIAGHDAPEPDIRTVLLAVLSAVAADDFDSLPAYFTGDAELHIHGFPPFNGSWVGRAAVMGAIASNFRKISEQQPLVESMIQHGDEIALRIRETGRLIADPNPYKIAGVLWFVFEGAKIKRIEEFLTSI